MRGPDARFFNSSDSPAFIPTFTPAPMTPLTGAALDSLRGIVASDLGGRRASMLSDASLWERAFSLCWAARSVLIVTGFFIRSASAPETDGPPGSVILGRALALLGKRVSLATDRHNLSALDACSGSVEGPSVLCLDGPDPAVLEGFDLLVFLERPGRAGDGRYYDMKGTDIGSVVVPLDDLALAAAGSGVPVLGIGDGGNEAGMGGLYEPLARLLPHYAPFLSRVPSTVCLPVDVSNWGGYALAALLSVPFGRGVGLNEGEEEWMLAALRDRGAVDGVSGLGGCSVDGFALPDLNRVSSRLRSWYAECEEREGPRPPAEPS